jgi:hypothetical protein
LQDADAWCVYSEVNHMCKKRNNSPLLSCVFADKICLGS